MLSPQKVYEQVTRLTDIHQLFEVEPPPLVTENAEDYAANLTIDDLIRNLLTNPKVEQVKLTVLLPAEQITPELQPAVQVAIQRYLKARNRGIEQEIARSRYLGSRPFFPALIVFFVFNSLGLWLYRSSGFIEQNIGSALIVAAGVILTFSMWTWILDVWESRVQQHVNKVLKSMELSIKHQ